MESVKRKKIFLFLISLSVILFTLGVVGMVKRITTKPENKHGEIHENEVNEESVSISELHYQILKLNDGIYENVNVKYDEINGVLTINDVKEIKAIKNVNVYKIDELIMITYESDKINILILNKEYNEVYTNEIILSNYVNFDITSYAFNDRGIIIDAVNNAQSNIEETAIKEIKSVKLLLKYTSNNTFGEITVLDTVYKG